METEYLKEFLVMSEMCNYTRAANALFIAQPTLFNHIKSLESEFGVSLFEKQGKKIELSHWGKKFVPHARKILEETQQYRMEVEADLQERSNTLKIATNYNIKELTRNFFKENRAYKIYSVIHDESIASAFERVDCELALFCSPNTPDPQYEYIKYYDEEIVVALNLLHPLADRTTIRLNELRFEDFITPSSNGKQSISPSFLYSGIFDHFQPKVALNIEYGSEAAKLVSQGFGVSLLFRRTIETLQIENLKLVSLDPAVFCPVYLCWEKKHTLSPGAKKFIEYVKNLS